MMIECVKLLLMFGDRGRDETFTVVVDFIHQIESTGKQKETVWIV